MKDFHHHHRRRRRANSMINFKMAISMTKLNERTNENEIIENIFSYFKIDIYINLLWNVIKLWQLNWNVFFPLKQKYLIIFFHPRKFFLLLKKFHQNNFQFQTDFRYTRTHIDLKLFINSFVTSSFLFFYLRKYRLILWPNEQTKKTKVTS